MKQNSLSVPIVGGCIAFLCFFLPWIKLNMSALGLGNTLPQMKVNLSVSGFKIAIGAANLTTLAFLAALAILGVCLYMMSQKTPWKSRTIVLISSGIGVSMRSNILILILLDLLTLFLRQSTCPCR